MELQIIIKHGGEQYVDKKSPSTLDNKTKMGLVKRWAFYDKSLRLNKKFISDKKTLDWATKTEKEDGPC